MKMCGKIKCASRIIGIAAALSMIVNLFIEAVVLKFT